MAEVTYEFNSELGSNWTDPENFVDGSLITYASAGGANTEAVVGNNCPGTNLGTITKVELRVYGYGDGNDRIDLTPIFGGSDYGDVHQTTPGTDPAWSAYVDITSDTNASDWSSWSHVQTLDTHAVRVTVSKSNTTYGAKVEIRVTYTPAAGWTHKYLGVANASIGKICGVAIADIAKVNGVA